MKKHLALTGFMGSGKTTIGKMIARKSGLPFIDLDEHIVQQEKKSIHEIFQQGEDEFRKIESYHLKHIIQTPHNLVIALGGGSICFNDNLQLVLEHAWLLALMPDINTLLERLWKERDNRPLLKNIYSKEELKTFIETKLNERMPFYQKADWVINF